MKNNFCGTFFADDHEAIFCGIFLRLAKGNNVLQNLVLRFRGKSVITNSTKINSTVIYSASFNSFKVGQYI